MKQNICAIFDIGRKDKKLTIYDESFGLLKEEITDIPPIKDEDGFRAEDIDRITEWILTSFDELLEHKNYALVAVNFISYGGAMVHIGKSGKPVCPVYDVLKPLPYGLEKDFYAKVVQADNVLETTESPFLGMLNAGVQLFWLKEKKPAIFKKITHSLFLPQYGHYLLTGKIIADHSSLQCHSILWDVASHNYHPWVKQHGITTLPDKTADFRSVAAASKKKSINVGIGLQASVAAIMPYASILEPFILSSSRNWTINSNPMVENKLTEKQLGTHLFAFNISPTTHVHSTRLYAGNEHDRQVIHLSEYFGKPLNYFENVKYDPELVWSLREKFKQATPDTADARLLLDCPFVERNMNIFTNYEEAYHQFMMDLVAQQVASLKQVLGTSKTKKIIFDGNFNHNEFYIQLLNEAFFDKFLYVNDEQQSSSLGAAMVIAQYWTETPKHSIGVTLRRI